MRLMEPAAAGPAGRGVMVSGTMRWLALASDGRLCMGVESRREVGAFASAAFISANAKLSYTGIASHCICINFD